MEGEHPEKKKKLAVVDGSNVAHASGKVPKLENILKMQEALKEDFEKVVTFIDPALRHKLKEDDKKELERLVGTGKIVQTPKGEYGDEYMLAYADKRDGVIVSNDTFEDFKDAYDWLNQTDLHIKFVIVEGDVIIQPVERAPDPNEDDYWRYVDVKRPKEQLVIPKGQAHSLFEQAEAPDWWKRGGALAIDMVWATGLIIIAAIIGLYYEEYYVSNNESNILLAGFSAIFAIVGLFYAPIYVLFKDFDEKGKGRSSAGKKVMGLKVVDINTGRAPGLFAAFLREGYWIFLFIAILLSQVEGQAYLWFFILWVGSLIVEIVFVLEDPKGRRLGDRFAGTQVVEK